MSDPARPPLMIIPHDGFMTRDQAEAIKAAIRDAAPGDAGPVLVMSGAVHVLQFVDGRWWPLTPAPDQPPLPPPPARRPPWYRRLFARPEPA